MVEKPSCYGCPIKFQIDSRVRSSPEKVLFVYDRPRSRFHILTYRGSQDNINIGSNKPGLLESPFSWALQPGYRTLMFVCWGGCHGLNGDSNILLTKLRRSLQAT